MSFRDADGWFVHLEFRKTVVNDDQRELILSILAGETAEEWIARHPQAVDAPRDPEDPA